MQKEKIAVIGSGISGISCSLFLSKKYDVFLFEKNDYLGGHTRTRIIENNNNFFEIDTGFIVFNNDNYPDLVDFPIPGNDDAIRSINLYVELFKATILDAREIIKDLEIEKTKEEDELKFGKETISDKKKLNKNKKPKQ